MDFATKFKSYVRTATPLVLINTFDARATQLNIIQTLEDAKGADKKTSLLTNTGLSQWDICTGLRAVNELGRQQLKQFLVLAKVPAESLYMAENLYKVLAAATSDVLRNHFTFVFNAHKFWSNPTEVQG